MRKPQMVRHLKSTRVRAALSLGVVLGLGATTTLAYWTDTATVTGGTFQAGTLDIKLGSPAPGMDNNPPQFTADFAAGNMQPGESKAAEVVVRNSGSVDFTYTASATGTGALAPLLRFKVVAGGSVNVGSTDCTGGTTTFGPSGTIASGTSVIGPTGRTLTSPAGNEKFCVVATLPSGETGGQGSSATVSFTFSAKQVGAP
jgi:predicted ribosomally synthesized peptide with SipW-like signal peptide